MPTNTDAPPLSSHYDDIRCPECRTRLLALPVTGDFGWRAVKNKLTFDGWPCGNYAGHGLGHQYVHTHTGRVAVCITQPVSEDRTLPTVEE